MLRTVKTLIKSSVLLAVAATSITIAADWPMFRYESNRSAISPEQLSDNLYLQWVREYPAPQAAWDNQKEVYCYGGPGRRVEQKLSFDIAYQPVVMGDMMYFGSPNNDRLTALQLSTGTEKWRFYAGGPIRLAPVAMKGKVIFGSDDGYLYCLDGANGALLWKQQLAGTDRKVMGNDRLVSVWPVRGAPVVPTENKIYNPAYTQYWGPLLGDKFMEIMNGNDAVEERLRSGGSMDMGSSDLELGYESPGHSDPQIVGLRFSPNNSVWNIQKSAGINGAYIQFTVDETKGGSEPLTVEIVGELPVSAPYTNTDNNLSNRTNLTSAIVEWVIPSWTSVGDAGSAQSSPDIAAIVNEIMQNPAYNDGDPINILIKHKSGLGTRCAESSSAYPKLIVDTEDALANYVPGEMPDKCFEPVDGNCSAEEFAVDGSMYFGSSDIELGFENHMDPSSEQIIGLRMLTESENWKLPLGAAITSAYIQFTVDETKGGTDPLVVEFVGELGDAAPFAGTTGNFSGRSANYTTARVQWDIPSWTSTGRQGADQRSPDLSSIITEIMNSEGYVDGAPLNIFIHHVSGTGVRCAESYGDANGRARLYIESDDLICLADTSEPDEFIIEDNADSNIVYAAAGLYSFEGAAVYGLDINTGEVVMKNDGSHMFFTENPHGGSEGIAGIAPQGYLCTAIDNGVFVPNGRALPALFDRTSGELRYWRHGGMSKGAGGYHVVSQAAEFYVRDRPYETANGEHASGSAPAQFNEWDLQIQAGDKIYKVEGTRDADFDGQYDKDFTITDGSWSATVSGMPKGLVAANGHLIVTTVTGNMYCFGEKNVLEAPVLSDPVKEKRTIGFSRVLARRAKMIIDAGEYKTGSKGICVVENAQHAILLEELVTQGIDLTVIAFNEDPAQVKEMREYLDARGIYGHKVQVLEGSIADAKLPPYIAQIVVNLRFNGQKRERAIEVFTESYRVLRPYGGVALFNSYDGKAMSDLLKDEKNAMVYQGNGFVKIWKKGALTGSDTWTHEYKDAAQTNFSSDNLVKGPLGITWFGGSADNTNDKILPRHGHGQSPQIAGGRLYIMGKDIIRCTDQYTGRVLWEKEIPNIGEFSEYSEHEAGNIGLGDYLIALEDKVYVLSGRNSCELSTSCLVLDPATGETINQFFLPESAAFGMINVYGDKLIATAQVMQFDEAAEGDCWVYWYGSTNKVGPGGLKTLNYAYSKKIFVLDRHTGEVKWDAEADQGFFHRAIVAGDGKIFAIDKTDEEAIAILDRMGETTTGEASIKCFDAETGEMLWTVEEDVFARYLSYSEKYNILVQTSRNSRDYFKNEPRANTMIAYRSENGSVLWKLEPVRDESGNIIEETYYFGGPIMLNDKTIITQDGNNFGAIDLMTGEWETYTNPLTQEEHDFYFRRHYGCTHAKGCTNMITFRSGNAGMFDLKNMGGVHFFGGFKSGCTPNLIPGGGLLNAPEYTRTCGCSYPIQTSCAMAYNPEGEMWTSNEGLARTWNGGLIKSAGLNFGASGDRVDDESGVLFLEYPFGEDAAGYGSQAVPLDIVVDGSADFYRHHSAAFDGDLSWVAASGIDNASSIAIDLTYDAVDENGNVVPTYAAGESYEVTLYFAEPDPSVKAGDRVFSVAVNGATVASNLDIVAEAGAAQKVITRTISGIVPGDELIISFIASAGSPILSGISLIETETLKAMKALKKIEKSQEAMNWK